jgi:hypothetical protein
MEKVVGPADLQDTFITELKTVLKPGSSVNDTNYLTKYGISYEIWHFLTDTDAWFGFAEKNGLYELYWYWGVKPTVAPWNDGAYPDVFGKYLRMAFTTGADRPHSVRGNAGA